MTSNMIYIVAFGGLKCPRKIHLNTQWGGASSNVMGKICSPVHIGLTDPSKTGEGNSPCPFSVYGPENRIVISGKNKGRHCWANKSWPTSLWQNESSCYLYADQSPFKMDKNYNHQLFTTCIHQKKCCHVFLVCSMDKWNNSILFPLAIKSFEFCFISMVIIVYRIGVGIYYFIFCTLDLATKNISLIV